nr:MAG TPA: hypothetical protein [Caudoviricetes sp.]
MMNIYIPIADVTLTDGQTYGGQLPLWATRPLMVKVTTGSNEPVNITVRNSGSAVKTVTLPYQQYGMDIDLSFAAPLLKRADRNKSQGTPWFMQQELLFWVDDPTDYITIPVFHCDLTYWDTLGVDAALPQPPKPRIPGQTLDIFFPYVIHPSDAFFLDVEPVTGAPSNVILPATYVLGDTIDITYIKKLTIKNVWGNGLDQVINYEDRLMSDVVYDTGLQCALRARWNMRNGQWFWAAFKDYFWSNKFTPIRGRGGVTEQAEIAINLEYGEEYYNIYQELLVSSNVVFDLNIPGINQYQSKRFRAEVVGDTGARWSNSTKTYRQQVRFKTTELQDNYMFPLAPDQPPTPAIQFSAQFNPWNNTPIYFEGRWNNIYSNAAWDVESAPDWFAPGDKLPLVPADFAQGRIVYEEGYYWEDLPLSVNSLAIRTLKPIQTRGRNINMISLKSGYQYAVILLDADGNAFYQTYGNTNAGGLWPVKGAESFLLTIRKLDASGTGFLPISPGEMETAGIAVQDANKLFDYPAGNTYLSGTIAANTGEARSGNIVLKSKPGATTYTLPIKQEGAIISLNPADIQVGNAYQGGVRITTVTCNTSWDIIPGDIPSWLYIDPVTGNAGTWDIYANIQANTGAQRTTYVTFRSRLNTSVYKMLTIIQAGVSGNISVDTPTFNVDCLTRPVTVNVTSFGNWEQIEQDEWITPSVSTGPNGTTAVTLTIGDNLLAGASARTGAIKFRNSLTGEIATVTVNQGGAPSSIGIYPFRMSEDKSGAGAVVPGVISSENNWIMGSAPSWVSVTPTSGTAGTTDISVTYDTPNNTGAKRGGYLRIENMTTHEIAICIIEQLG